MNSFFHVYVALININMAYHNSIQGSGGAMHTNFGVTIVLIVLSLRSVVQKVDGSLAPDPPLQNDVVMETSEL